MYAIATEKGLNEDGKMQYEVFGVKLKELYSIRTALESIKREHLLESTSYPLLKRVLKENERDSLLSQGEEETYFRLAGEIFEWSSADLKKWNNWINFASIGHKVDTFQYPHVHDIYEEMLCLSKKYFGGTPKQYRKIHLSPMLYNYLKAFGAIKFKFYQTTPNRLALGSPHLRLGDYCNLSIAKSNAMILMMLTGNVTYYDIDGNEKSIILDGITRTIPEWEDGGTELPKIEPRIYQTNPYIYPSPIFKDNSDTHNEKQFKLI